MRRRLKVLLVLVVAFPVASLAFVLGVGFYLGNYTYDAEQREAEAALKPYADRVVMPSAPWHTLAVHRVIPGPLELSRAPVRELVRFGANPFGGLRRSELRLRSEQAMGEKCFLRPGVGEEDGKESPVVFRVGALELRAVRTDGGWEVTDATAVFLNGRRVDVLERLRTATPEAPLDLDALRR